MTPERGRQIVELVRAVQPATLINSRLMRHGGEISRLSDIQLAELREVGVDYLSYRDRQIPAQPQWPYWETCMTLNNSWGYTLDDHWKSADEVIEQLSEVSSKGGNYLLNVGPTAEGLFPEPALKVLEVVGARLARGKK
jgi:alpha-L-fucosidase